ncbi:4-alpha-glucanotransferase [Salinispirillum sp. LH 10-3-1]|uniref:4-alpha-glucanotransferase n=1 Tax=Salinispirillum sp. LH 10-3-1 TaxID=2952525 RepID=A0AB38YJR7_9GAMM
MANPELIAKLAFHRGIADRFSNYLGEEEVIPQARKEKILRAMGYDLSNDEAVRQAIFALDAAPWTHLLRPVYVLSPRSEQWGVEFHLWDRMLEETGEWSITLEQGGTGGEGSFVAAQLPESGEYWIEDRRYVRRVLMLPQSLELGYHRLYMRLGDKQAEASLIIAPAESYQNDVMARGDKIWGTAIQLYTLRSERNWGMGDFSDLEELIREMAPRGAGVIGLNPIHALYPVSAEHASPYSPSNRSFINPLYVDVTRVPEFEQSKALQKKVNAKAFQAQLIAAREAEQVPYAQVSPLKYGLFEALFAEFLKNHLAKDTARAQAFHAFVEANGEPLRQHALFEALLAHFKALDINAWGWPVWPEAYQRHDSPEVQAFAAEHEEALLYSMYLQFIADEQLRQVNQVAEDLGMAVGLYRDLAVGADRGGAEIWSNRERFCTEASVGAPPDALGPTGQNWGLPPLDPIKLEEDGYQSFITLVRNNMRGCGALRIDHAMALFRLWWCPPGEDASQGAYVHYKLDDLLGILNLESQRQQCMVIAEDLGTVPEQVVELFPAAQLYSNKVFYFEASPAGVTPPSAYAQKALAIVANHDMPTVAAYWNKSDLALRRTLSMFPTPESYDVELVNRDGAKQQILNALAADGRLPEGVPAQASDLPEITLPLSHAIHEYLASGRSQMVVVQLEDMLLINKPVNVPGTSDEYPNWRRKLSRNTQELFGEPETQAFCERLTRVREGRS